MIDRIHLHVELTGVAVEQLLSDAPQPCEYSAVIAARVARARNAQLNRQAKLNSRLSPAELTRICRLERESRALIGVAIERLGLSAGLSRVLKVARTCADLTGEPQIRRIDVSEAVNLRVLDRYLLSDTM